MFRCKQENSVGLLIIGETGQGDLLTHRSAYGKCSLIGIIAPGIERYGRFGGLISLFCNDVHNSTHGIAAILSRSGSHDYLNAFNIFRGDDVHILSRMDMFGQQTNSIYHHKAVICRESIQAYNTPFGIPTSGSGFHIYTGLEASIRVRMNRLMSAAVITCITSGVFLSNLSFLEEVHSWRR